MDGFLLLDKPSDMSSARAVNLVKRAISPKKIGHTGTLDPFATGLLVLCLGNSTKLSSRFLLGEKSYLGRARFGIKKDTGDLTGQTVAETGLPTQEEIERLLPEFKGSITQIPPMFSAVKVEGKRLYKLARKGIEVERKTKEIRISEFKLLDFKKNSLGGVEEAEFFVKSSGGTYIRQLLQDLAEKAGSTCHLLDLKRTEVSGLLLKDAMSVQEVQDLPERGEIYNHPAWVSLSDNRLTFLNRVEISEDQAAQMRVGDQTPVQSVALHLLREDQKSRGQYVLFVCASEPIALLEWAGSFLTLRRVFHSSPVSPPKSSS